MNVVMFNKSKDIALFVSFCIEEFSAKKGITGEQTFDLFTKFGVTDYLSKYYESLHTQGRDWIISDIEEFIDVRKNKK